MIQTAAPSIMPAKDRADQFPAFPGNKTHPAVPFQIAANRGTRVRLAQAHALGVLPQAEDVVVIRQSHRFDYAAHRGQLVLIRCDGRNQFFLFGDCPNF